MNGSNRLYRSTSDAILGGVAAGLANYFKIDATIVRIIFVALTFFSGGAFILAYVAAWLLMPTPGSTAVQPGDVVRENLNDISARFRGYSSGGSSTVTYTSGPPTPNNTPAAPGAPASNGGPAQPNAAPQLPPSGQAYQRRHGITPQALILIGVFFLLVNAGLFRAIHWSMWWPILLVGLGVLMLTRRTA
jgi:phage shock protein PspC (stress-responsive transcriptional regulator)